MKRGRLPDKIVRQIGSPKVFQIKRAEFTPQALRPGQLFPGMELLKELRPAFLEVVTTDNIFKKKLSLIRTV